MSRGPVGKRDAERRRRNKDVVPTETIDLGQTLIHEVTVPVADEEWHPVAKMWYESLKGSGQALFYEPSDWATAFLIAESMSRDLGEQVVGITDSGEVVRAEIPMKGASLTAYLKAMTALLVTEGDRRRVRVEVERATLRAQSGQTTEGVTDIAERRAARFKRSS